MKHKSVNSGAVRHDIYHPCTSLRKYSKVSRLRPLVRWSAHCSLVPIFKMTTSPLVTWLQKKCHLTRKYFVLFVIRCLVARRRAPLLSSKTRHRIDDTNCGGRRGAADTSISKAQSGSTVRILALSAEYSDSSVEREILSEGGTSKELGIHQE